MRRTVLMLILLLALGLCTSLLVAWAGALVDRTAWPRTPLTDAPMGTRTEMRGWLVEAGCDRTLTWRTFNALDLWDEPPDLDVPTEIPAWSVGHGLPDQPGPFAPARERTRDVAREVSAGWPMRCVRAVRTAGPTEFALPGEFVRGGLPAMAVEWPIPTSSVVGHDRIAMAPWPIEGLASIVPLHPMPLGLLANTLVYAVAWCLLLAPLTLWRITRRRRRRLAARCAWCGQPEAGLPAGSLCPECGHHVEERARPRDVACAPLPMLGAALALMLVLASSAALLTHRWMAVDRLPPLHHAAAVGDVERIERLLAGGADIGEVCGELAGSSWDVQGTTALHWAAARGQMAGVRTLLSRGLDPRAGASWTTPLHAAMRGRHEGIVELLLPYPKGGGSHWFTGQELPHTSRAIAAMVLGHRTQGTGSLHDAAVAAIMAADVQLLDELLRHGADPFAIGDGDVFDLALELDAAAWGEPYRHDLALTRAVLARGYGLDAHALGRRLERVRNAVSPRTEAIVQRVHARLLQPPPGTREHERDDPADRDAPAAIVPFEGIERHGRVMLWFAVAHARADLVRVLLEDGVDPRVPRDGRTPRQMLLDQREAALAVPGSYEASRFERQAADAQRILDLLEAAEARWTDPPQSPAPSGPG